MAGDNKPKGGPNLKLWMPLFFVIGIGLGLIALKGGVLENLEQIELPSFESPLISTGDGGPAGSKPSPAAKGEYEPMRCDHEAAEAIREKARNLAAFRDQGDKLTLTLGPAWGYYSEGLRRSFVEAFFESDGCLRGELRRIEFHYRGKLVAEADPDNWVRMYATPE